MTLAKLEKMCQEMKAQIDEINLRIDKMESNISEREEKHYFKITEVLTKHRDAISGLNKTIKTIVIDIKNVQKSAKNCLESE